MQGDVYTHISNGASGFLFFFHTTLRVQRGCKMPTTVPNSKRDFFFFLYSFFFLQVSYNDSMCDMTAAAFLVNFKWTTIFQRLFMTNRQFFCFFFYSPPLFHNRKFVEVRIYFYIEESFSILFFQIR